AGCVVLSVLSASAAHATENYFVQCGDARLINVYGHHGYTFTLRIGEREQELPSRVFRFDNHGGLYFRGRKCVCAPVQWQTGNARWRKPMLQRIPEWLATGIAALFLATGTAQAREQCDTLHTSDSRGIWQCGNVCVRVFGNAPNRYVTFDGVDNAVNFKWRFPKASLNGKRCKLLAETYDYDKGAEDKK